MTRPAQTALTILAVLLALYVVRCDGVRAGRQQERLADSVRVTERSRHTTDSLRVEMAHRESVAVGTIRRQGQQIATSRSEIARLKASVGGRPATPNPVIPGTDAPPIASVGAQAASAPPTDIAIRDSIIAQQDTVIARLDTVVTLQQAMLASRDTIIGRLERERESYRGLAEDFRRRAEPGILEQARRALPWMAAAVVVWEIAR